MDPSVLISGLALGVSAIGFFYKIGQDTKRGGDTKLDQVLETTNNINKKLDKIAEWQRDAASIHATHDEQIKTLFNKVDSNERRINNFEDRMNDREIINESLKKILEKVS